VGYAEAIRSSKPDGCDVALYCIMLKMLLNHQLFNRSKSVCSGFKLAFSFLRQLFAYGTSAFNLLLNTKVTVKFIFIIYRIMVVTVAP